MGHFTAVLRVDRLMIKAKKLIRVKNFNYELDLQERTERGEGLELGKDTIVIKKEDLRVLKFKANKYDKIDELMADKWGLDQIDLTEPVRHKEKEKDVKKEREVEHDIKVVEKGESVCNKCNMDCKTSSGLQRHIDTKHRDIAGFVCKICNKGFVRRDGYKKNKRKHKTNEELEKLAEDKLPGKGEKTSGIYVCKDSSHNTPVYCLSRNSFKSHLKQFHREKKSSSALIAVKSLVVRAI